MANRYHRRITESYYEKKRKEYRAKQREINGKIAKLHLADEEYYLTSEYLLKLASKASKLFESSEAHEKRQLLKLTLQNLELKDKKVRFNWIKPFDITAIWLPSPKINLTIDISHIIKVFEDFRFVQELREEIANINKLVL